MRLHGYATSFSLCMRTFTTVPWAISAYVALRNIPGQIGGLSLKWLGKMIIISKPSNI